VLSEVAATADLIIRLKFSAAILLNYYISATFFNLVTIKILHHEKRGNLQNLRTKVAVPELLATHC
jgi:hypothetical protein